MQKWQGHIKGQARTFLLQDKALASKAESPKFVAVKSLMAPPPSWVANKLRSLVLPPLGKHFNELIEKRMQKKAMGLEKWLFV